MRNSSIGLRWTIGDVSPLGFEALRLSVVGAWNIFGPEASYSICVNTVPLEEARSRAGELPPSVRWISVTLEDIPEFLRRRLDGRLAEGVAWKFAPLQVYPDRFELSLDNDCILWELPDSIRRWIDSPTPEYLLAEDVRPCFGIFAPWCGSAPRNTGIRGVFPGGTLPDVLRDMLQRNPIAMTSELDEQGLQTAALQPSGVVTLEEVSICSPFPPHMPRLGRCGAHFVGLNSRRLPWDYYGRPASDWVGEHWKNHRPSLYRHVGLRAS